MSKVYEKAMKAYESIKAEIPFSCDLAVVLGSGLGGMTDHYDVKKVIPYSSIDGFPQPSVKGHSGNLVFAENGDTKICFLQGRVHYYEGYDIQTVVLYVRLLALMGIKRLIITNAAGGVDPDFVPGDIMLITDHIAQFIPSPLAGENAEEFGTRFPDMTHVYSEDLIKSAKNVAKKLGFALQEGVYIQLPGPAYETPAEISMVRALGASAVGMSTAAEAMTARHCGIDVLGISLITNMAAGLSERELSHAEVENNASVAGKRFSSLVKSIIEEI